MIIDNASIWMIIGTLIGYIFGWFVRGLFDKEKERKEGKKK